MASFEQRRWLFWTNCIPMRMLFAILMVIACTSNTRSLQITVGVYSAISGVGLWFTFTQKAFNDRKLRMASPETVERYEIRATQLHVGNFGGPVWWHPYRPVHGSLAIAFSIGILLQWRNAFVFPLGDVMLAILLGIRHYHGDRPV